jgi:hypothetical protein
MPLTFQQFQESLSKNEPPDLLNDGAIALWFDGKGQWDDAHEVAQVKEGTYDYDRIHAYLHRKEGDDYNARYWYRRIGLAFPSISLEEEWIQLVKEYLTK